MQMHQDQLSLRPEVARRLIGRALLVAGLPGDRDIRLLSGAGTTSYVLRVGEDLLARFPMQGRDPAQVRAAIAAEHTAMTEFARVSPFPSARPVTIGEGDGGYPLPFSVQTWVPGEVATPTSVAGSAGFADDLARLIGALREAGTLGRSFGGTGRGGDLTGQDAWMTQCFERSEGMLAMSELRTLWSSLRALPREDPDVMSHADLIPANLLVADGRLVGVLDTGGFAAADPALDLVCAWHLLEAPARAMLREHLDCPELEWRRGAAWAFAQAMGLVWYYEVTNPPMAELGRSTLARLLAESDGLTG
ncbi:phosphotransferase [Brachybacterium hainanense]|uniref:Phosphotransferase n=1 Tax=Brachybacterium hainanense TaxID=1541174 RepID=A0ABV6R9A7_9MICO